MWEQKVINETEEEVDDAEEELNKGLGNSDLRKILLARRLQFRNILCDTWLVLRYKVTMFLLRNHGERGWN